MTEHEDLVREFLIESAENLDRLDRDLVELEKDPQSGERLASIFRTIHTIKGTVGFLGFTKLESVSHIGENLLSRMRDFELSLDAEITTALLSMVDAIRRILASVEATGQEGDEDQSALIARLTHLNRADRVAPPPREQPIPVMPAFCADDVERPVLSESSLRVDVALLDKLMNLVGELVLARNQILQFTATETDPAIVGAAGRLNLVTSELQEGVMKTRMQPIGSIWDKFPRIVRDLATACSKQVRIEMEGKDTDLDKAIVEAIKDPLTHAIRNSVDHGIESPHERVRHGKPPEGRIRLRACHEGGEIDIEISDDGAGIDPAKVRRKALQRGLITAEQAGSISDHDAIRLVFLPGFSTTETITNLSGRGVGMDVVKTNIERIGGQVDIESTVGEGTTLTIRIPLTLAIIPALIVVAGGDRYAIPQVNLLELVRLEGTRARLGIERIQDALFYRLRGTLLPLVYLQRELGVDRLDDEDAVNIVVVKTSGGQFGLVVEEIRDTEEIVVKPLGRQLKGVTVFAGATIMGDGRVALILDVLGIARRAHLLSNMRAGPGDESIRRSGERAEDRQALLLFEVGETGRMAIPLNRVARLEEFPRSSIERSGEREVVQYRDAILPLVSLSKYFTGTDSSAGDLRRVVVFVENGRHVGLVVDRILDIVSEPVTVQLRSTRPGVIGSAVIQRRVTDLLDVQTILRATDPTFFGADAA